MALQFSQWSTQSKCYIYALFSFFWCSTIVVQTNGQSKLLDLTINFYLTIFLLLTKSKLTL